MAELNSQVDTPIKESRNSKYNNWTSDFLKHLCGGNALSVTVGKALGNPDNRS